MHNESTVYNTLFNDGCSKCSSVRVEASFEQGAKAITGMYLDAIEAESLKYGYKKPE